MSRIKRQFLFILVPILVFTLVFKNWDIVKNFWGQVHDLIQTVIFLLTVGMAVFYTYETRLLREILWKLIKGIENDPELRRKLEELKREDELERGRNLNK